MEPEPFVGSPDRDIVPKEITTITNTKSVSFSPDRDIVPIEITTITNTKSVSFSPDRGIVFKILLRNCKRNL